MKNEIINDYDKFVCGKIIAFNMKQINTDFLYLLFDLFVYY